MDELLNNKSVQIFLKTVKDLSSCQGFYCRLNAELERMQNANDNDWNDTLRAIASHDFKDSLDVIFYLEQY